MKRSARLTWQNLTFLARNPRFGIVPATVYLMTCWLVGAAVGDAVPRTPWRALRITLDAFGANPGLALWIFAIVGCFLAFTDTHSRAYRVIGGLAHCAAHLAAMFYVGWGARAARGSVPAQRQHPAIADDRYGHLRRRLGGRLLRDGHLPADLAQCLRPPQRGGVQRASHRGLQALPPPAHRSRRRA